MTFSKVRSRARKFHVGDRIRFFNISDPRFIRNVLTQLFCPVFSKSISENSNSKKNKIYKFDIIIVSFEIATHLYRSCAIRNMYSQNKKLKIIEFLKRGMGIGNLKQHDLIFETKCLN